MFSRGAILSDSKCGSSESIENFSRIKIGEIKTVLINSDFNVNFKIKRNILHSILKDKYPNDDRIDNIFNDLIEDRHFCITKITNEIKLYQKVK